MEKPRNKKHRLDGRIGSVTTRVLKYGAVALLVMLAFGLSVAYYAAQSGETVALPKPIRERLEQAVANSIGTAEVHIAEAKLALAPEWDLAISLTSVDIASDSLADLSLAELSAKVAFLPLLSSVIQPSEVKLRGLQVAIPQTRSRDRSSLFDFADSESLLGFNAGTQWLEFERLLKIDDLSSLQKISLENARILYHSEDFEQKWEINSGSVALTRSIQEWTVVGEFDVQLPMGQAATVAVDVSSATSDGASEFVVSLRDIAASDLAGLDGQLAWLNQFDTLLAAEVRGQINATGEISAVNSTLAMSAGQFRFQNSDQPVELRQAEAVIDFNPAAQAIHISRISIDSSLLTTTLVGDLFLENALGTDSLSLLGQLFLQQAEINSPEISQEPVTLTRGVADVRMTFAPLRVELGQLTIMLGETAFSATGHVTDTTNGLEIALDASVDTISVGNLKKIWPQQAVVNVRNWVNRNLTHGHLDESNFTFRKLGERPSQVHFFFNYSDAEIHYMKSMPPLLRASGQASFYNNRFSVTANAGYVRTDDGGVIDVGGTSFIVIDTAMGRDTRAEVDLRGNGSLTSVLTLLNRKPLEVLKGTDLLPTSISGTGSFEGLVQLPLQQQITLSDLSFDIRAQVTDVVSDSLVVEQRFAAQQLTVTANQRQVQISGDARISDIPISGEWTKPIGRPEAGSSVKGSVALNEATIQAAGLSTGSTSIAGEAKAEVRVSLVPNQPPRLTLNSDLVGLSVDAPALKWRKPIEDAAELALEVSFEQPVISGDLAVMAPNLTVTGTFQTGGEETGLDIQLEKIRIGDWLDAAVAIEAIVPARIRFLSGKLNLREAPIDSSRLGQTVASGVEIIVTGLDELQITPQISLTDVRGQINTGGGVNGTNGTLSGRVNGGTPVSSEIVSQNEQVRLVVTSDDAGASLRDANLLQQVHQGELRLEIRTTDRPQEVEGTISMRNTFVRDVPAIAALLNVISVVGLLNELTGQGIYFGRVESKFRIDSEKVTFIDGQATGPSLGFTMSGAVSQAKNVMDVEGVISPLYMINQVGGLFSPRQGEGLFGFNYRLTGDPNSPQVAVNILSGLAPGFLRELFRVGAPTAQPENNK